MIFGHIDQNLEAHLTPLGAHLAPEGSFGGLRAKYVHFPMGKLTFFQNSLPCLGKSENSENAKKSKIKEKSHHFLRNVSFPYVRATISVIGRRRRGMRKRSTLSRRF